MIERPNPFLDSTGRPFPGQGSKAIAFAEADYQQYLDSLTPDQREEVDRQHRNFVDHMQVAV